MVMPPDKIRLFHLSDEPPMFLASVVSGKRSESKVAAETCAMAKQGFFPP
jgi:hypothetical protein